MIPISRSTTPNKLLVYFFQILFVAGVLYGSQSVDLKNRHKWPAIIARYIIYLLVIRGSRVACVLAYQILQTKKTPNIDKYLDQNKTYGWMLVAAAAVAYHYNVDRLFGEEFLIIFIAHLITMYPVNEKKSSAISYGSGMACSFFEGYLVHIMPNDGAHFGGFEEKIRTFEDTHGVEVPAKKLFLIITKSMFCPPDLKEFNKPNRDDLPRLEASQAMEEISKDVAGVKNRRYQNSMYKIHRAGRQPVYLAAECATPVHTLYRAMQNAALTTALANIDVEEVLADFSSTLTTITDGNPAYKGKLVIVYYDDTDSSLNLADVLLEEVKRIEPDFEDIILKGRKARRNSSHDT